MPLLSKVHDHRGFENAPKNKYAANLESGCTKSRDQGYRSFACAAASWKFYLRCIGVIRPSNRRRLVGAGSSNSAEPSPPCAIKRRNLNENPPWRARLRKTKTPRTRAQSKNAKRRYPLLHGVGTAATVATQDSASSRTDAVGAKRRAGLSRLSRMG